MIVMVGQPELAQKINKFKSLRSRMVSASLTEMTKGDMQKMIEFRWTVAARDSNSTPPFSADTYDKIYKITKGNPRLVCKLCDLCLLQGFIAKAKTITPELVKQASKEL